MTARKKLHRKVALVADFLDIGLLAASGTSARLGDATYEAKRDAYVSNSENLLARSLHPLAYQSNPNFRRLLERTSLPDQRQLFWPVDEDTIGRFVGDASSV